MRWHVAHSVRGRLRVRYPAGWLKPHRDTVVSALRDVPGVRRVEGSRVTGSVRIEYDPFRLAESALVDALRTLDQQLDTGADRRRTVRTEPGSRVDASSA